jgi:hypothetical protein
MLFFSHPTPLISNLSQFASNNSFNIQIARDRMSQRPRLSLAYTHNVTANRSINSFERFGSYSQDRKRRMFAALG